MTAANEPKLRLAPGADGVASAWTTEAGELHLHDYGFDDYGTEVIALDAPYEHRTDVTALDWDETHRTWTGDAWQLDFAALDTAVEHFLECGYEVTIAATALSIFLSDYDAPFLDARVPDEPAPVAGWEASDRDGHPGLDDF